MTTVAQETAPQTALKNCSKEVGGRSTYTILVKGEFSAIKPLLYKRFSASHKELIKGYSNFLDMRRCKDWDHEISS